MSPKEEQVCEHQSDITMDLKETIRRGKRPMAPEEPVVNQENWYEVDDNDSFSVKIHCGGQFVQGPKFVYTGGQVHTMERYDLDHWSLQELVGELKSIAYKGFARIYYRKPGYTLQDGLVEALTDGDTDGIAVAAMKTGLKEVIVYVLGSSDRGRSYICTIVCK